MPTGLQLHAVDALLLLAAKRDQLQRDSMHLREERALGASFEFAARHGVLLNGVDGDQLQCGHQRLRERQWEQALSLLRVLRCSAPEWR